MLWNRCPFCAFAEKTEEVITLGLAAGIFLRSIWSHRGRWFFFSSRFRKIYVVYFCHAMRACTIGLNVPWCGNPCHDRFLICSSTSITGWCIVFAMVRVVFEFPWAHACLHGSHRFNLYSEILIFNKPSWIYVQQEYTKTRCLEQAICLILIWTLFGLSNSMTLNAYHTTSLSVTHGDM